MSKWTDFRDHLEGFVSSAFHKGIDALEPLAQKVGESVTPAVEAALLNAGKAVAAAAIAGTAHNSDEMVAVALKSLRTDVPTLEVAVSTGLAAATVQQAANASAQALNSPLNVPPAQ